MFVYPIRSLDTTTCCRRGRPLVLLYLRMFDLTVAMRFPEDLHSSCLTCQLFRFTHLLQSDFTTLQVLPSSWFSASFAALPTCAGTHISFRFEPSSAIRSFSTIFLLFPLLKVSSWATMLLKESVIIMRLSTPHLLVIFIVSKSV
jgi:hypothetical protein